MTLTPQDYRKTRWTHRRGTRANQPLATDVLNGTLYFVTDESVTERSNGTIWETYSGSGSSTIINEQIIIVEENNESNEYTIPGPQGSIGPTGNTGLQGIQGPIGLQGYDGEDGIDGYSIIGPTGPQGITGATGAQGNIGPPGVDGESSSDEGFPQGINTINFGNGSVSRVIPTGATLSILDTYSLVMAIYISIVGTGILSLSGDGTLAIL